MKLIPFRKFKRKVITEQTTQYPIKIVNPITYAWYTPSDMEILIRKVSNDDTEGFVGHSSIDVKI